MAHSAVSVSDEPRSSQDRRPPELLLFHPHRTRPEIAGEAVLQGAGLGAVRVYLETPSFIISLLVAFNFEDTHV